MRKTKFMALLLCITMILSGCGSMNNTTKGGLIGGGGGADFPCPPLHLADYERGLQEECRQ